MPVIEIRGNLLESGANTIFHGCNCFWTWGAGVAKAIKERYPEAYKADVHGSKHGDVEKLGTFTKYFDQKDQRQIFNLYTQYNFGTHRRQLDYEALAKSLEVLKAQLKPDDICAGPRIGCGLAGGDWSIVRSFIEYTFPDRDIQIYYL